MKKKVLALVLCLAIILSVLPISVFAEETKSVAYIDRFWDGEKIVEVERQVTNCETVTSSTARIIMPSDFYVQRLEQTA